MHGDRYDKKSDLVDVEKAVLYSRMRVPCAPPTHPVTGTHLWKHLIYARALANETSKASDVGGIDSIHYPIARWNA